MPRTKAQSDASRKNSLSSTGPRTVKGKARSRRKSLKNGMTGEGICVPPEDAKEVEARFDAMCDALLPLDEQELTMTRRACVMAVRVDRSVFQEAAILLQHVRDAIEDHDAKIMDEVFDLIKFLDVDPASAVWKLKRTVQGVDWMNEQWQDIREMYKVFAFFDEKKVAEAIENFDITLVENETTDAPASFGNSASQAPSEPVIESAEGPAPTADPIVESSQITEVVAAVIPLNPVEGVEGSVEWFRAT